MSLTSATTSLWSNTMCLRSWSFSEEGKESEQSTQVTRWPSLEEARQAPPHSCSGKQSGSSIQSCSSKQWEKTHLYTFIKIWHTYISLKDWIHSGSWTHSIYIDLVHPMTSHDVITQTSSWFTQNEGVIQVNNRLCTKNLIHLCS